MKVDQNNTETVETNETFSTQATEQQTTEKTTEEHFYGQTEDTTKGESQDQTAPTEESSEEKESLEAEKVEGEQESDSSSKTEDKAEDKDSEWTLELPEHSFLGEEDLKNIEIFAKENNLGKDAAAAILDRENKAIADYVMTQDAEAQKELQEWRDTVINDPDIGGENLKATVESSRRVVDRFGNEEFISLLNDTGYGDHPEVVRFLSKIGKLMSDDSLVTPQNAPSKEKPLEDYFYGPNANNN